MGENIPKAKVKTNFSNKLSRAYKALNKIHHPSLSSNRIIIAVVFIMTIIILRRSLGHHLEKRVHKSGVAT